MMVPELAVVSGGRLLVDAEALAAVQGLVGPDDAALLVHLLVTTHRLRRTPHAALQLRISDEELAEDLANLGWGRGWAVKNVNVRLNNLARHGLLHRPQRSVITLPAALLEPSGAPAPARDASDQADRTSDGADPWGALRTVTVPNTDPGPIYSPSEVPNADPRSLMSDDSDDIHHPRHLMAVPTLARPAGHAADIVAAVVAAVTAAGVNGRALARVPADPDRALACLRVALARGDKPAGYFTRLFNQSNEWPADHGEDWRAALDADHRLVMVDAAGAIQPPPPRLASTQDRPGSSPATRDAQSSRSVLQGAWCAEIGADEAMQLPAGDCPGCRRGLHQQRWQLEVPARLAGVR